jgi:hypothetical protein
VRDFSLGIRFSGDTPATENGQPIEVPVRVRFNMKNTLPPSYSCRCCDPRWERQVLADIVEKLFWVRIGAILVPSPNSASTKDSKGTRHRFKDCVTLVWAAVFQQNRREPEVF